MRSRDKLVMEGVEVDLKQESEAQVTPKEGFEPTTFWRHCESEVMLKVGHSSHSE